MKLIVLTFISTICLGCYGDDIEDQCNELNPEWLEISPDDLKEICNIVKKKDSEYTIHSSAPSHKGIYDFPMIEIHFLPKNNQGVLEGPTYFYWKKTEKWEELEEVSGWQKKP